MLAGALLVAFTASIYLVTLFPGVPGGDSGELLAEACLGGTAHPPGYPTFTLLSAAATKLPGGATPAAKASALFALIASVTPLFIAGTISILGDATAGRDASKRSLLDVSVPGFFGGMMFAVSPLTWLYSSGSEVFSLNNFFVAWVCFLAARYDVAARGGGGRVPPVLGTIMLVSGLGLTNQHTLVLLGVPLAAWVLLSGAARHGWSVASLATLTAKLLVGLVPYAYLVLASLSPTPGSWGDMTTVSGFFRHFIRAEYGTFQLSPSKEDTARQHEAFLDRMAAYKDHVLTEVLPIPPAASWALFCVGCCALLWPWRAPATPAPAPAPAPTQSSGRRRTNKPPAASQQRPPPPPSMLARFWVGQAFVGALAFYIYVFHKLANLPVDQAMPRGVLARFWMQPDVLVVIIVGVGWGFAVDVVTAAMRSTVKAAEVVPNLHRKTTVVLAAVLVAAVHARLPYHDHGLLAMRGMGYGKALFVNETGALTAASIGPGGMAVQLYGEAVLAALPPQSILLSHTDLTWNSVRYLQACEARRPDVTHLSLQLMPYPWFARQRPLFPGVDFPPVKPDATTSTKATAYKRDLVEFLLRNLDNFPGGVFVDLHAVSDMDFGEGNVYAGSPIQLLPWGLTYKAVKTLPDGPMATLVGEEWHAQSAAAHDSSVEALRFAHPLTYPDGTWEHAVLDIFTDSVYQRGLALLAFQISLQNLAPQATVPAVRVPYALPIVWHPLPGSKVTPFLEAARLLDQVLVVVESSDVAHTYPMRDYVKNMALAMIRAMPAAQEALASDATARTLFKHRTRQAIDKYLELAAPNDPDRAVFENIKAALEKRSGKQN